MFPSSRWQRRFGKSVAIIAQRPFCVLSHEALAEKIETWAQALSAVPSSQFGWLICDNSIGALCAYLAAVQTGIPLALCHPQASFEALLGHYRPGFVIQPESCLRPSGYDRSISRLDGLEILEGSADPVEVAPHQDLRLLLSTSGSTGSSKFVRLSSSNLQANASSIVTSLETGPDDVAVLSLPMSYAFGLSVVNSHLLAGAAIAIPSSPFLSEGFWDFCKSAGCTTFAGLPHTYETLHRLGWAHRLSPPWRVLLQAGGALRPEIAALFNRQISPMGGRMYVMYGQTEATARISYVPHDRLEEKPGSIGVPISGGRLSLRAMDGTDKMELIYRGPNVMMGYAHSRSDLSLGNVLGDTLCTGDLGLMDPDGFFRITGRASRFAKVCGKRIELADVERIASAALGIHTAAACTDSKLLLFLEDAEQKQCERIRQALGARLQVPFSTIEVSSLKSFPLTPFGKVDYQRLGKG